MIGDRGSTKAATQRRASRGGVFINCPFDRDYLPFFHASVFTVYACGYVPRCGLEVDDGSEVRFAKICRIVSECDYSIHDLSRTSLDPRTRLARFNMPFELGLFLGCKLFGGERHRRKSCLILEGKRWQYRKFLSDIAGQDIHAHEHRIPLLIEHIRDWLRAVSGDARLPVGPTIILRYDAFQRALPRICQRVHTTPEKLRFLDYAHIVRCWLKENRMRMVHLEKPV